MFDPAEASKNIKQDFISYIVTSYQFADKDLRDQLQKQLDGAVAKGPYIQIDGVFKTGKSMEDLIRGGVLSPLFRDLEKKGKDASKPVLPVNRKLYLHQERAIRSIVSGENAVITTGTGSGKTNCFLIPVIDELLKEKANGTLGPGIRAMFIYPMNALANDQIKTLRNILFNYPDITFGVYNGETDWDESQGRKTYKSMYGFDNPKNELVSREWMKQTPPNIIFTNYSMLEHLLFRPDDDQLFQKSRDTFKFVVLDEAHVYSGATGIETSILLRRLKARLNAPRPIQFILTSATLGTGSEDDKDITAFARNLCGEEFHERNIIRSEREKLVIPSKQINLNLDDVRKLAEGTEPVKTVLAKYGISPSSSAENDDELLYNLLEKSNQYIRLRQANLSSPTLNKIKEVVGARDTRDAVNFISLCTRARRGGKQLVDARYHFFVRCLEGVYVSFPNGPKGRKVLTLNKQNIQPNDEDSFKSFEVAVCSSCGHIALVGCAESGVLEDAPRIRTQSDQRDFRYFIFDDDPDDLEEYDDLDEGDDSSKKTEDTHYQFCLKCGAIKEGNPSKLCECDPKYRIGVRGRNPKPDTLRGPKCGRCVGHYERFYLGSEAATSVLATSLYQELPRETSHAVSASAAFKNPFLRDIETGETPESNAAQSSDVRQFLVFSDSRQQAAKFAVDFERSYQAFLRRRGIWRIASQRGSGGLGDYVTWLTNLFTSEKTFRKSYSDNSSQQAVSNENAWVAVLDELSRFSNPKSLTSLGLLQFRYRGNTPELIDAVIGYVSSQGLSSISKEEVRNLLDLLSFEVVKNQAVCTDNSDDIDELDREYIFYTRTQRYLVRSKADKKSAAHINWLPASKPNGKIYPTARLNYVKDFLGCDDSRASDFLGSYFDWLTDPRLGNPYLMKNDAGKFTLPARYFDVLMPGDPDAHWYRCRICGRISQFNIKGRCSNYRCGGQVDEVDSKELRDSNHFADLYSEDDMSPMIIKEHTAQLSRKEGLDYQQQFIKKEINALSCSTTFELGVDVGDLETVFLRDVPPTPANYAQRAGRAGRSIDASAFCLTYAKLSNHDLYFFRDPTTMIQGTIKPPIFKIDNEKIVRRHVYDVAISMYLKDHPEQYDGNKTENFIDGKGYVEFEDWLNSHPDELRLVLEKCIPDINNLYVRLGIKDFGWLDEFIGKDGVFTALITEYEHTVAEFDAAIKDAEREWKKDPSDVQLQRAVTSLTIKKKRYQDNGLIDFLVRGNVLPRYGFPVDTVELEVNSDSKDRSDRDLRLSRDLSMAISEYAPSSEVVADGRMYTSRYIRKSFSGDKKDSGFQVGYFAECRACDGVNFSVVPVSKGKKIDCRFCKTPIDSIYFHASLEPRAGFVTEPKSKDVPLAKQEHQYRTEPVYISNTSVRNIDKKTYELNGERKVTVEVASNDSILVRSKNPFFVCPECGYALAEDELDKGTASSSIQITTKKPHPSLKNSRDCDCKKLDKYFLHYKFDTDVAKVSFSGMSASENTAYSVMYAILHSMTETLNIDRKDLGVCLFPEGKKTNPDFTIVLYDAVPGGAGYTRKLLDEKGDILKLILHNALYNMKNCDCDPSCYKCLRSYDNQRIHDKLDRNLAADFLRVFVS